MLRGVTHTHNLRHSLPITLAYAEHAVHLYLASCGPFKLECHQQQLASLQAEQRNIPCRKAGRQSVVKCLPDCKASCPSKIKVGTSLHGLPAGPAVSCTSHAGL